jgi:hypothetical protein
MRDRLTAGLVAGIAGGVFIAVFVFAAELAAGMPPSVLWTNFAFVAATLLGPSAGGSPLVMPIGLGLHFCVAIGWALGYAYLVRTQPQLVARPWVSGAGFGIVVYVFMMIVLITAGQYHRPPPGVLGTQLIAHIAFYGIPVALIVARMLRPHAGAGPA